MTKTLGTIGADKQALSTQRLVGGVMVVAGLAFGFFNVVRPLQDASRHVATLSIETKGIFVTPLLLIGGLACLLFPKFMLNHTGGFQSRTPKTVVGWAFVLGLTAISFAFMFWMQAHLRALGYSV